MYLDSAGTFNTVDDVQVVLLEEAVLVPGVLLVGDAYV